MVMGTMRPGTTRPPPSIYGHRQDVSKPMGFETGTPVVSYDPAQATDPPRPSTGGSNTFAAQPWDSGTSRTTSRGARSRAADSDHCYTLDCDEPVMLRPGREEQIPRVLSDLAGRFELPRREGSRNVMKLPHTHWVVSFGPPRCVVSTFEEV